MMIGSSLSEQKGGAVRVPFAQVEELNQPHLFSKDIVGNLEFEDGLKCDYSSIDMKAKLYQICFLLEPLVKKLNFNEDCLETQLECVRVIRGCLDLITFNKGTEKIVVAERHKVGSVAKLALFGQGNCHGCSSLISAFLLPFSKILGIDIKYRGGFSFAGSKERVSNQIERHQWVELTFRPSMHTLICDLWHQGVNEDDQFLTWPQ
mmetsp:Transcript_1114/g.2045  ORF Transcript_1114/g.2045 Transcript_1114/m.2045 type:complete len:206 (-) Transcript_1114:97-714(-)